jgi:hypothetical protein
MIKEYYHNQFRADLTKFMPDARVPYFGHSWGSDCRGLNKIPIESRPTFLICLYFTVLVDQAMYTHYCSDYQLFAKLTQYPKFCHGLGQFQKNPRELLLVPVQKGMVDKSAIEKELCAGMELFVDEVVDFLLKNMTNINPAEFFDKLIYDSDVQIPRLIVIANPKLKDDIVFKAYESLRAAVEKKLEKKG